MDEASLETRPLALPAHYWRRIEAEVSMLDTVATPEEWIRDLIYRQFRYSAPLDLEVESE